MISNMSSIIEQLFEFISNDKVKFNRKNNIDKYLIITEKKFDVIISYEYFDNIWNLYITYNKSSELDDINYSQYVQISGKKEFYKKQDAFIRNKVGVIKYIMNSRNLHEVYLEYFSLYIKNNLEILNEK